MIEQKIEIDGKSVPFKASAAIPRIYRAKFGRDIFRDMMQLSIKATSSTEKERIEMLEMFENIAYIMAKHADPTVPDTPEEWLDQFDTFSIYDALPRLLDMWHLNIQTSEKAKKKQSPAAEK